MKFVFIWLIGNYKLMASFCPDIFYASLHMHTETSDLFLMMRIW